MPRLVAVVPVRQGSGRVPDKNFKPFGGQSLLEIKLAKLTKVTGIDEIVVNTDSDLAIEIANRYGVSHFRREPYYASSSCTNSEHWRNLAETTGAEYVMHTLCTSPLIELDTYARVLEKFESNIKSGAHDSINTVRKVKEYLWLDGKPINYAIGKAPNSQDLPDVVSLTFGISIISRELMIERGNVVGTCPSFYPLGEIEVGRHRHPSWTSSSPNFCTTSGMAPEP
ncbi:MAG: NTP transferase domain-containing protein [Sphingomonas sp.]